MDALNVHDQNSDDGFLVIGVLFNKTVWLTIYSFRYKIVDSGHSIWQDSTLGARGISYAVSGVGHICIVTHVKQSEVFLSAICKKKPLCPG